MKKSEIALAIICILITAYIFITVFVGWGAFGFGPESISNISPPSANETLFEKAEWEKYHGGICQCAAAFELLGPITLHPSTNSSISRISFNVSLVPGGPPAEDIKNTSFTLSTKNAERTVLYHDPAVNLTHWLYNGTLMNKQEFSVTTSHYNGDPLFIELDLQKMGFTSPSLGPGERFSLVITPPQGYRFAITRTTPVEFSPGTQIEIPGYY
jgi:archaellin